MVLVPCLHPQLFVVGAQENSVDERVGAANGRLEPFLPNAAPVKSVRFQFSKGL